MYFILSALNCMQVILKRSNRSTIYFPLCGFWETLYN